MIVLIDNYDSFSYNLVQLVGSLSASELRVVRNDALTVAELAALAPDAVLLSPGSGRPSEAGICEQVVRELSSTVPILGVCLGHQAICEAFGARITHAPQLMHGKASQVTLDTSCQLFADLPSQVQVGRYHSLVADADSLPSCLRVVAKAADGTAMAVAHTSRPTFGLQFHPESILTPEGSTMLRAFLSVIESAAGRR